MIDRLKAAIQHNMAFWVCLIFSIVLLMGGAITPPRFVIDKSIFIGVGELFAFGALGAVYKGLDQGIKTTLKKGDVELTVGDNEEEKED
jgi:hypothetical protein